MCSLVQKVACTKELFFTINLSMLSYLSFHFRLRNQKRLLYLPKAREYIRMEFLPLIFASLDIMISLNLK